MDAGGRAVEVFFSEPVPFSHLALSEMIDELLPAGNFLPGVDPASRHAASITFPFTRRNYDELFD